MEIIKSSFLSLNGKKVFTILCIHNEGNSPLLEVYAKKVHSSTHTPQQIFDLKLAKYVGIKIPRNISETSYEFVIAFENEVISFGCKRWELMNDWVYCLKTKLRELKVLSPKENIYTKPPVMRPQFVQRRNPREDPLPERPAESQEIPGLEFIQSSSSSSIRTNTITTTTSIEPVEENVENAQIESFTVSNNNVSVNNNEDDSTATAANPISIPIFNFATSNTSSQNLINLLSNPLFRFRNNSDLQFANNFDENQEEDDEEDDDDENIENGENEKEIVLPTSLNIEYVPPTSETSEKNNTDDNITIISVTADNNSNNALVRNGLMSKHDKSKVTKIKIEIDYDNSKIKESSQMSSASNNIRNSNDDIKLNQAASTSSFNNKNIIIEKKESTKSAPCTPKKTNHSSSTPKSTPLHEKRKLSLREQQVLQLRNEINTEIRFRLRKKDCVDAIAFAAYGGRLWIAGFKPNPQLYVFHIGDQLLAINNIANIKSPADAQKFIKMCAGLFVEVTIKRLPLAGIYVIKREFENQCLGLIRDRSSLLDIIPNSIASRSGIPTRPYTSENEDETVFWIITEINFRPLSLISHKKYDETELLLNAVGLETSLLLQPSNFIAKIQKELKAMKNYRDYTLQ